MDLLSTAKTVMMTPGEVSKIMPLVVGYRHALGMSPPLFYGYRPHKTPRMKSVCPAEAWGAVVDTKVALTRLLREGGRVQDASVTRSLALPPEKMARRVLSLLGRQAPVLGATHATSSPHEKAGWAG